MCERMPRQPPQLSPLVARSIICMSYVVKEDVSNGFTVLAAVSVLSMPKVGQAEL